MRQITEVLRLNAQGLSYRQIAQSVGISASTVQSYLERAQRARLSWPLPDDVDDASLEARLFTRTEEELRPGRPEPNWLEVHREHKRGKHVTVQLLHLEYKAVHPDGLSYTQMFLCSVKGLIRGPERSKVGPESVIDLAGYVALQAADNFALGTSLERTACSISSRTCAISK